MRGGAAQDPCAGLTAEGTCDRGVALWCAWNEFVDAAPCTGHQLCGWDAGAAGYRCVPGDNDPCRGAGPPRRLRRERAARVPAGSARRDRLRRVRRVLQARRGWTRKLHLASDARRLARRCWRWRRFLGLRRRRPSRAGARRRRRAARQGERLPRRRRAGGVHFLLARAPRRRRGSWRVRVGRARHPCTDVLVCAGYSGARCKAALMIAARATPPSACLTLTSGLEVELRRDCPGPPTGNNVCSVADDSQIWSRRLLSRRQLRG